MLELCRAASAPAYTALSVHPREGETQCSTIALTAHRPRRFPLSLSLFALSLSLPQTPPVTASIQQRNGRKTLTTVQGISPDYDQKKLVKVRVPRCPCP